jgi:type I restriction enzyme, S subunit
VRLGEVLQKSDEAIELRPDAEYREITVKLWGKGVVLRGIVAGAEVAALRRMVAQRIDARNGALGIVPDELDGAIVSSDFPVFNLATNLLLPSYLGWMCKTAAFVEECRRASEGTTNRVRLQEDTFLAKEIPLPPLSEQQRIVARIEELAAQIREGWALRQEAAAEAEALTKAELNLLVTRLLKVHDELSLGEVTTFIGDMNHEMPSAVEVGVAFVSPRDFTSEGTIDFTRAKRISQPDFERLSKKCCPRREDILMARYGTVGEARIVETDHLFLASYSIAVIRPDQRRITTRYLHWMIVSPDLQRQILSGVRGGIQADLGLKTIRELRIPVPPLPEQQKIVVYLDDLQQQTDALKALQAETSAELNALIPSILDKAFRGEL